MKILIAEDEPVSRRILSGALTAAGYEVTAVADGTAALRALAAPGGPKLAVLDWMMPGMDGVEVVRMIRSLPTDEPPYLIVLTSRDDLDSVVTALEIGANDHVGKSQDVRELLSRVKVGARVAQLQADLARRTAEAESALAHARRLEGLLPICSYCKRIRRDGGAWQEVELYVREHSEADFSHSVCPSCYERIVEPQIAEHERRRAGGQG
jgi:DNA-binding response OmpR family regulator